MPIVYINVCKACRAHSKSPGLRQHPQGHLDPVRATIRTLKGASKSAHSQNWLQDQNLIFLCLLGSDRHSRHCSVLRWTWVPTRLFCSTSQYPIIMKNEPLTALESNSQRDEVSRLGAEVPCQTWCRWCTCQKINVSVLSKSLLLPWKLFYILCPLQNTLKSPEKSALAFLSHQVFWK